MIGVYSLVIAYLLAYWNCYYVRGANNRYILGADFQGFSNNLKGFVEDFLRIRSYTRRFCPIHSSPIITLREVY